MRDSTDYGPVCNSRQNLVEEISSRIGDLHDDEDIREQVVDVLARDVIHVAQSVDIVWGNRWGYPIDAILPDDNDEWVEAVADAINEVRLVGGQ